MVRELFQDSVSALDSFLVLLKFIIFLVNARSSNKGNTGLNVWAGTQHHLHKSLTTTALKRDISLDGNV